MNRLRILEARCLQQPSRTFPTPRKHFQNATIPRQYLRRSFHCSPAFAAVKPYLLADIGEGITECQIIQWFVQPGARVEQFDKICEVQSDKASVEITSRFDGVIKKLYYEADDMAKVGKPLVDIDIQSEISPEDEALTKPPGEFAEAPAKEEPKKETQQEKALAKNTTTTKPNIQQAPSQASPPPKAPSGRHATLATPAVRHLTKELNIDIADVTGTGKDGRVLKEDIQKFAAAQKEGGFGTQTAAPTPAPAVASAQDRTHKLTPIQSQMYKTMTRSLSIPHFLYTDNVDFTDLNLLRKKFNAANPQNKLSALPFILKAVSMSLLKYPLLNAHLDTSDSDKPKMTLMGSHNLGVAMDTPQGLLVPVIKDVQNHSIASLATEISRLASLAKAGKLPSADLSGATFTVSNIGSIGGTAVAPVIVNPQVAILGVGRSRTVPCFDKHGNLARKEEAVFSWSADHRVIDGAMAARCAEGVREHLEDVGSMLVALR